MPISKHLVNSVVCKRIGTEQWIQLVPQHARRQHQAFRCLPPSGEIALARRVVARQRPHAQRFRLVLYLSISAMSDSTERTERRSTHAQNKTAGPFSEPGCC